MSYQYAERKNISRRHEKPRENAPVRDPLVGGLSGALSSSQRIDLPGALQDKMETAFGADFSALKLYRSPEVSEAGDLAVAQGGRIAFAPDAPSLTSRAGQELLGHELSHVVSQAKGEAYGSGLLENASLEAKADREGSMAASGMQISAEAETVSIGGAETGAAPMQAKRRKGKKARRRSAPVRSRRVKAPKVTQSAPSSTASEGESHSPAIIDAISGAAEGGAAETATETAKAVEEAAPEAAAQSEEAAQAEEVAAQKPSKGARIGKMIGMGAGFLGSLAGTASGVLGNLGFGVASTIVGGVGKGLGALGDFIGSLTGGGNKGGEAAGGGGEGPVAEDQAALAGALGDGDLPPEAVAALAEKKKKS